MTFYNGTITCDSCWHKDEKTRSINTKQLHPQNARMVARKKGWRAPRSDREGRTMDVCPACQKIEQEILDSL